MSAKHKALFMAVGIAAVVILMLLLVNVQAPFASPSKAGKSTSKVEPQKELNINEAIQGQNRELLGIIEKGGHVPGNFRNYDVVYFQKLDNGNYRFKIQGEADLVNVISPYELYEFDIHTFQSKESESMDRILNMPKAALNGLLAKESNLPVISEDYNIIYYMENVYYRQGEYEFGIEAEGKQYYFLLENYSRFTPEGRWAVLGWSEGSIPEDWNDVLAVQYYASISHNSLGEQEYEQFFAAYADNVYKLLDENSKLMAVRYENYNWAYNSKHYGISASNGKQLYEEANKVMRIDAPDKYEETHNMLVNAMYRVSRQASVYVKGSEGYMEEADYNNSRWYGLRAEGARDILNKAYACYETEKRNQVFDENKYKQIEEANRIEITRLIDKQINKYTKLSSYAHPSVRRINNKQYRYCADEGSGADPKRVCYTFEKDKDGKWMIVSKTER